MHRHTIRPPASAATRSSWQRVLGDEDGGAYTLSYVMVVPIIMFLVCLLIETTLMMTMKLGTVYAAYSGARVASVWASAADWGVVEQKIEKAAKQAFVPFASGSVGGDAGQPVDSTEYLEAYRAFADDPVADAYVKKKYRNAHGSLTVTTDGPPSNWNDDIQVTVVCECPFRIPGIGRLLGERSDDGGYYIPLKTVATLQNDGPQNEAQDLGIGYGRLD